MKIDFPSLDHKFDHWRPLQIHGWNLGHQILKNSNLAVRSKSLKLQKNRRLIAIFLAKNRRFFEKINDISVKSPIFWSPPPASLRVPPLAIFCPIYRCFTDISPIYRRFCRFFRRSIIGDDYRFGATWYPIFLQNIGNISRFFNPCVHLCIVSIFFMYT